MLKTGRTRITLPQMFLFALLWTGSSAWAQNSGVPSALPDEPQVAQPADGGVNWKGVGIGAGTVVSNLFYVPAKLVYGVLGGIAGGAGYALTGGNKQVADSIWRSSLGGDYVLTPEMMTGKKPIYFSGPSDSGTANAPPPPNRGPSSAAAAPPAGSLSSAAPGSNISSASQPIDSGAGFVGANTSSRPAPYAGAANPGVNYRGYSPPQSMKRSAPTDTSIE